MSGAPNPPKLLLWARAFLRLAGAGAGLLTKRERTQAIWLTGALLVQSLLDALAVTLFLPFVAAVVEPGLLDQSRPLRALYIFSGAQTYVEFIQRLALLVLALLILNAALSWVVNYALNLYAAACQTRLAQQLLEECVAAPYSWFLTRNSTTLARFFYDDVSQWSRGFVQRLMSMVSATVTTLTGTVLVIAVAPGTGLVAITLVSAAAAALMTGVRPRLTRLAREKRAALDRTLLAAAQVLSGIKDVKLSSRSGLFVRSFSDAYRATSRTHARLNALQQIVPIGVPLLGQTILVGVALLLIGAGRSRGAVAGEMALLLLVTSRVVPSIGQLASSAGLLASVTPYVDAIHELRRSIARSQREAARSAPTWAWDGEWRTLRLADVGYQYPGSEAPALGNLTLEITAGHAHGIAGPSGAGKSTLVDLLLALLDPARGQLLLDGRPFDRIDRAAWQARIGYVPQSPYIADDTLRANVAFGVGSRDVDDAWVKACLESAQLGELLADLPQGLDTSMGDRGTRVSGGQRQRIAVARALYNRPKLLVLDEATSALDRISESAIQEAIRSLRGSVTTITIAHRLSTIRDCDAIFLLDRGQLVDQGPYDALLERQPLFRQMASEGIAAELQPAGVAS